MKHLAAFLSSAVILTVSVCFPAQSAQAYVYSANAVGYLALSRGDLDASGTVDMSDVALLADFVAYGESFPTCSAVADVDRNGRVDLADLACLTYVAENSFVGDVPQGELQSGDLVACVQRGSLPTVATDEVTVAVDPVPAVDGTQTFLLAVRVFDPAAADYWNATIEVDGSTSPARLVRFEYDLDGETIGGHLAFARDFPAVIVRQSQGATTVARVAIESAINSLPSEGRYEVRTVGGQWCGTTVRQSTTP